MPRSDKKPGSGKWMAGYLEGSEKQNATTTQERRESRIR